MQYNDLTGDLTPNFQNDIDRIKTYQDKSGGTDLAQTAEWMPILADVGEIKGNSRERDLLLAFYKSMKDDDAKV